MTVLALAGRKRSRLYRFMIGILVMVSILLVYVCLLSSILQPFYNHKTRPSRFRRPCRDCKPVPETINDASEKPFEAKKFVVIQNVPKGLPRLRGDVYPPLRSYNGNDRLEAHLRRFKNKPADVKLLNYTDLQIEDWKPNPEFADSPRITYFNGHRGCQENLHGVLSRFRLNFRTVNPRNVTHYGMREQDARELIDSGYIGKLCNASDIIIVADTVPDARGILLSLLESNKSRRCQSNIVVEMTNRYDWMVGDKYEYHQMLEALIDTPPSNLWWVANNPFEEAFFLTKVGRTPNVTLIRSLGVWNVENKNVEPVKDNTSESSVAVVINPEFAKTNRATPMTLVDAHKIPVTRLPKHYGGPPVLLQYKAYLEFPYQVSIMKFYENLAAGVPQVIPTPRLLFSLVKAKSHHLFATWLDKLEEVAVYISDPDLHAKMKREGRFDGRNDLWRYSTVTGATYEARWMELTDFYASEFRPYVYYFDSFEELAEMVQRPWREFDVQNVRVEGPRFYKKLRRKSMLAWRDLFEEMGYEVLYALEDDKQD
ncbi:hypothetical protein BC830DRAFT_1114814 [Chytriomyces sp. MP71]|nr:hypothetical protein BC830DRAFT_1114814 [Chytriomyces sp. MP71]